MLNKLYEVSAAGLEISFLGRFVEDKLEVLDWSWSFRSVNGEAITSEMIRKAYEITEQFVGAAVNE